MQIAIAEVRHSGALSRVPADAVRVTLQAMALPAVACSLAAGNRAVVGGAGGRARGLCNAHEPLRHTADSAHRQTSSVQAVRYERRYPRQASGSVHRVIMVHRPRSATMSAPVQFQMCQAACTSRRAARATPIPAFVIGTLGRPFSRPTVTVAGPRPQKEHVTVRLNIDPSTR